MIPMITANASTVADDLGITASGDAAIKGALKNDAPKHAASHVIFPSRIPGDVEEQPHDDLSHALFNKDTLDNISSQHLCPITQEPPFDAVHFDVPIANGATIPNQQVYERSASEVQSKMMFMGHQISSCHVPVVRSFFIL